MNWNYYNLQIIFNAAVMQYRIRGRYYAGVINGKSRRTLYHQVDAWKSESDGFPSSPRFLIQQNDDWMIIGNDGCRVAIGCEVADRIQV